MNGSEKVLTLGRIVGFSGVFHLRNGKTKDKIMRSENEFQKKNLKKIGHLPWRLLRLLLLPRG